MFGRIVILVLLALFGVGMAQGQDAPRLPPTKEKLTAAEVKKIRRRFIIYRVCVMTRKTNAQGITVCYPVDIVGVGGEAKTLYVKKPQAMARWLLKIVKNGRPEDSIRAATAIKVFVWDPKHAATFSRTVDSKTWDEPIAKGKMTHREWTRRVCVQLIRKKEKQTTKKNTK